jgi:hypothetical protein
LEVFCFKEGISVKEYFEKVRSLYLTAEKYDIPFGQFSEYVNQLEGKANILTEEIKQLTKKAKCIK